jgi:hypothetical protein
MDRFLPGLGCSQDGVFVAVHRCSDDKEIPMKRSLLMVATATVLSLGVAAGPAMAQASSPTSGSVDQAKALKKQADADYKAAKKACNAMKGDAEKQCEKDAKATHEKAEADAKAMKEKAEADKKAMK